VSIFLDIWFSNVHNYLFSGCKVFCIIVIMQLFYIWGIRYGNVTFLDTLFLTYIKYISQ